MKQTSLAIFVLIFGQITALAEPPEIPILGHHYSAYDEGMHGWKWLKVYFDDSKWSSGYSEKDKGQGGYFDAHLDDLGFTYNYDVTVCFQPDKRISLVCYFCLKGGHGGFFSPDEVEYLLGATSGTSFKEVPSLQSFHCVAGVWKLYSNPDGRIEATVGYTTVRQA